jgi:hypothetical protein
MPLFGNKEYQPLNLDFKTRSEAFSFMLTLLMSQKTEPLKAAQQADEFAEIFAKNKGLPDKVEPPKEGIDKVISMVDKTASYFSEHPQIIDFITGAATFAVGLFAGKKNSTPAPVEPMGEKIDFNAID